MPGPMIIYSFFYSGGLIPTDITHEPGAVLLLCQDALLDTNIEQVMSSSGHVMATLALYLPGATRLDGLIVWLHRG